MRIEQLTFTRFIAAIIVVVLHFGLDIPPFNQNSWSFIFIEGRVFVSYFFVLSGFVMVIAYKNSKSFNLSRYFINRFARIYPVYFFSILLTIVGYWLLNRTVPYYEVIFQSILANAWIPKYALTFNYTAWSLGVEVFFYLTFPWLLLKIYTRYRLTKATVVVFFIWAINQAISAYFSSIINTNWEHNFSAYNPLMHINEFLIGNVTALFLLRKDFVLKRNHIFFIGSLFLLLILLSNKIPMVEYRNGFLAPVFALIMYTLSSNRGQTSKILSSRVLVVLGEISYSIYILQVPIYYISNYFSSILGLDTPSHKFYFYLFNLILSSLVTYYSIELPMKSRINNLRLSKNG